MLAGKELHVMEVERLKKSIFLGDDDIGSIDVEGNVTRAIAAMLVKFQIGKTGIEKKRRNVKKFRRKLQRGQQSSTNALLSEGFQYSDEADMRRCAGAADDSSRATDWKIIHAGQYVDRDGIIDIPHFSRRVPLLDNKHGMADGETLINIGRSEGSYNSDHGLVKRCDLSSPGTPYRR